MPPRDCYTQLTDAQMRGLHEAGASANEWLAYCRLTRFHNDPEHPSQCWASAKDTSDRTGINESVFSRSLRSLCKKCFYVRGQAMPILTQISRGHNGNVATYRDNLYQCAVLDHTYP